MALPKNTTKAQQVLFRRLIARGVSSPVAAIWAKIGRVR